MSLPLDGFTVLDFGQVYNGPYCGFLLAQAGARVIKVESLIGETLRARGERVTSSYPFALLNANKESLAINIKSASGQSLVKSLANEVDVISENFAPGTMAKKAKTGLTEANFPVAEDEGTQEVRVGADLLPTKGRRTVVRVDDDMYARFGFHVQTSKMLYFPLKLIRCPKA